MTNNKNILTLSLYRFYIIVCLLILVLCTNYSVFAQQTIKKTFISNLKNIEITTDGLDEIKIINSKNKEIEIALFDENLNTHSIKTDSKSSILKIQFKPDFNIENNVFRKYITKRLNRVSVTVKLPKDKNLTILGTNTDIISKNYNGNISIYIDKGLINLNEVQQNAIIKLFQGNIFATVSNSNINIKSTKGKIFINEDLYSKHYKKESQNAVKQFSVLSINANVTLSYKH